MKPCNAALAALLDSGMYLDGTSLPDSFVPFDLYTITLVSGTVLTLTTANIPICAPSTDVFSAPSVFSPGADVWFSGMTWLPSVIDAGGTRSTGRWRVGLDTDTWTIHLSPRKTHPVTGAADPDTVAGIPWATAARTGMLDHADVIVSRAYFSSLPTYPVPDPGAVPVGTLTLFRGTIGDMEITDSSITIVVSDYKSVFDQLVPRNVYQSGCPHQLYDSHCGLSRAAYAVSGAVATGSSRARIKGTVSSPGGSGTWALGRLAITSGPNAGISRLVTAWSSTLGFTLMTPFPYAVTPGETFTVYPGCNKTLAACALFGNTVNFGGNPFIPIPEVSL